MTKESLFEQATAFFFKILLPPLVGISIKVAIKMEREKMTTFRIILAYIIGVGCAWLASPVIVEVATPTYAPMILATVAITGDKIAEYLIYKLNIDGFMAAFVDFLLSRFKK